MFYAGRQYDGNGKLRDWWLPSTAHKFSITTQCMKEQYDEYTVDGLQVGITTLIITLHDELMAK